MIDRDLIKYTKRFDEDVEGHVLIVRDEDQDARHLDLRIKNPLSYAYHYHVFLRGKNTMVGGDMSHATFEDCSGWFCEDDRRKILESMGAYCEDHLDRARYATSFLYERHSFSGFSRKIFSFELFLKRLNTKFKHFRDAYPSIEQIDKLRGYLNEEDCIENLFSYKTWREGCQGWLADVTGDSGALLDIQDIKACFCYTYTFIWNSLAVVHALKLYDAHKAREAA